ncbi:hypothetical protein A5893_16775 [Pedobacter psychrophilus]|uniref:Secretion system C-terminal sorting domain-containing protein n=1 Tax=Pedobacter psychrophilus TaxID=1826909 RepID=A0A179DAF7_9SPHI|nr:T9SS type A sorting domain-containing protein [Pedobacter psychrophilus]OAQ38017.1 hypothetical protein A5893_16775 [Pedobacter psychrophilus]
MIKKLLVFTVWCCFITKFLSAQTVAEANWALTANQNASVSGNITALSQALAGLNIQDYISGGIRTIPTSGSWPAQSNLDASRYLQYTVKPTSGNVLNISSINASLSFNGSGTGRAILSWSTDKVNFTQISSTITLNSSSTPTVYTFNSLNINVQEADTLYLRIYPWTTGLVAGKYLITKAIKISGKTFPAANVTWPLIANQMATTVGNIYASSQFLKNLTINNYLSSNGGQRIIATGNTWPNESVPNINRYIQYKVSPTAPNQMRVSEINVPLSFNSASNAKAKIAYAVDTTSFTSLVNELALASGTVPVNHKFSNLNITVPIGQSLYIRIYPWTNGEIANKYLVSKNVSIKMDTEVSQQIAFPSAEGGGKNALGGRGGSIYYVTNLNNSGAGSLRDAVSAGNRTVLFKVSGTIYLDSTISIQHDNITIAGQTAPGDGICLANYGLGIRANHVIVRFLRSRPGDVITDPRDSSKLVDAMYNNFGSPITNPYKNIIVDHCSLSWSTDETGSFYAISNFTLQWSILSESLYLATHPKPTPHGYGGIWGGQNASFHHNLIASHYNRNPRFSGSQNSGQPELEYVDFRNNVVFNWYGSTYGGIGGHQNMVNNYYKSGPATAATFRKKKILDYSNNTTIQHGKFFITGNYVNGFADVTANNWLGVEIDAPIPIDSIKVTSPFYITPIITQTATDAYNSVLNNGGATLPRRDTVDRRIIKETTTGIATYADASFNVSGMVSPSGIINSQTTVGGWPTLSSTTYAKDTDGDGLPDWWEAMRNGGGVDSTSLNRNSFDLDGYTLLENYINNIPSPDTQVSFTNLSGIRVNTDSASISFNINWAKDQFNLGLYRSYDNVTFTKIKNVDANINSTNYSFLDDNATTSAVYYKIGSKRIDNSGVVFYSNVVEVPSTEQSVLFQELISFSASKPSISTGMVILSWEIGETNTIKWFDLERKSDSGDFNYIKGIYSGDSKKYSITDYPNLSEPNYYRLKINKTNGEKLYSNILAVNKLHIEELKVFPNPAQNILWINYPKVVSTSIIFIYSIDGKLLNQSILETGSTQTTFNITNLATGTYTLVYLNSSKKLTTNFIKTN